MARKSTKKQPEAPKIDLGAEIFASLRELEKEKGIPVDYMVERLKQALANAYRKDREDRRDVPAENVVVYAKLDIGNVYYKVHVKGGVWLPEVKNREDYAGIKNEPIDGFMIKGSRPLTYRVHLRRQNRWLPWVTGYNTNDHDNGYAGIIGQEIDAIQIK